jgi:hypothetical protein
MRLQAAIRCAHAFCTAKHETLDRGAKERQRKAVCFGE